MTLHRTITAFWLIVFLAIVVSIMDAPAQSYYVNYNPNTVSNGQMLYWDNAEQYWAAITSTTVGRAMVTAADAAAQRALLSLGTAALVADNTLVHKSGAETITGTKTFNGPLIVNGDASNPSGLSETQFRVYPQGSGAFLTQVYYVHGAPSNEKFWDILTADDGKFSIRAVNDAFSDATTALVLDRVGITPTAAIGPIGTGFKNVYYKTGTLSSGTVTITDANIGSTDIVLPVGIGSTNAGALNLDAISAGASFTITSTNASDARDIRCIIYDLP